jgi:hypothetical protein
VGRESASTVGSALTARSAVGQEYASTVVNAITARSAVARESASTVVIALGARSVKAHACDTISATKQTAMMEAFDNERSAKIARL